MSQSEKKRSSRTSVDENAGSRHRSNRSSNYGGSISDIEADDGEKYRKMAKKLARDKSDLKDKLRRLLDDIELKSKEHRIELEKTQDYFQDQINDLVEERDKAREALLEEKEKVIEKLARQKETLEKRHGGKDSQAIKRLENTIATLQDRLTEQVEKSEHIKDTAEQFFHQKEEQLRKTISELEEQLQKVKELGMKDRRELHMLTKTHTDEKEQLIRKIRQEKDEEIAQLTFEKNNAISALQSMRDQIEKRTQELDRRRDGQLLQATQEIEQIRADYERKHSEFIQTGRKSLEENRDEFERKLKAEESRHKTDVENMVKEHDKALKKITAEYSHKISVYTDNFRRETEESKKTIVSLRTELATVNEKTNALLAKKEEELRKNIEKCNSEYQHRFEMQEKELNILRLKNDKISGESEETAQRLKDQLAQVRENMKKLQDNSQMINNQFVFNLNKQKELADKEITSREQTIAHLERQIRKIGEESVDKFNHLERKTKTLGDENKELIVKLTAAKTSMEKQEQMITSLRSENQKIKDTAEKIHENFRQLQFEKNMSEQKNKAEAEQKMRETSHMAEELEETKKKANSLATSLVQLQSQMKNVQEIADKNSTLIANKDRDIECLVKNLNNANAELSRMKKIYSDELHQKLTEVRNERDKQLADAAKKSSMIEAACRGLERMSAETQQNMVAITLERDRYKAAAETSSERERLLLEANKKISGFEQIIRTNEQARQQLEHKIQLLHDKQKLATDSISDKERQLHEMAKKLGDAAHVLAISEHTRKQLEQENKVLEEKYKQLSESPTDELETKEKEVQKLQEEIGRLKTNFSSTLNNISQEVRSRDSELRDIRTKLKESEDREGKLKELLSSHQVKQIEENNNLKNSLALTKAHYDALIAKTTEEKNAELAKATKKIFEMEQTIEQKDRKIEKLLQDFTKQITDVKKVSFDEKLRTDETEKENIRLQAQLEMSEKKLFALQAEFATTSATMRSKIEQVKVREEELKNAENALRSAPPKLLDPSMKKARDEALTNLRHAKVEMTKAKDECVELTQKLFVAESLIKDLEKEKQMIINSQSDLKETFVNNLNQQQEKHEKELAEKSERIKELETLLMNKLNV